MRTPFTTIAYVSWLALLLVWLPGYFRSEGNFRAPKLRLQIPISALLIVGFVFLLNPAVRGLAISITPQTLLCGMTGVVLDLAGVLFAAWARFTLGRNWSGLVMGVKERHELVQTGPYAIVRHPIYAGLLLAAAGTALTLGTLSNYIGLAVIATALAIRVSLEEELMNKEFREIHESYRRRTKKLIPFVW